MNIRTDLRLFGSVAQYGRRNRFADVAHARFDSAVACEEFGAGFRNEIVVIVEGRHPFDQLPDANEFGVGHLGIDRESDRRHEDHGAVRGRSVQGDSAGFRGSKRGRRTTTGPSPRHAARQPLLSRTPRSAMAPTPGSAPSARGGSPRPDRRAAPRGRLRRIFPARLDEEKRRQSRQWRVFAKGGFDRRKRIAPLRGETGAETAAD